MFHNRNTFKNSKTVKVYFLLWFAVYMVNVCSFMFAFLDEFRLVSIIVFSVSLILSCFLLYLLYLENNNYKLKFVLKLKTFNVEFNKLVKQSSGNVLRLKEIKKQQKDYFLQFGTVLLSVNLFDKGKNSWNEWVKDATCFSYPTSKYMEKLSFLTYVLYDSCMSGSGLESFLNWVYSEPFTKEELIEIIGKNEFFCVELKDFIINIIKEFDKQKEDELFERYELDDNQKFFSFDEDIFECANYLAYNRALLSTCVGVYLHGNIDLNIYRLFISKDYREVVYIYNYNEKPLKINHEIWDAYTSSWDSLEDRSTSYYDSEETALNEIKDLLERFIELQI